MNACLRALIAACASAALIGCTASHVADSDGDGFTERIDCDDGDARVYPGTERACTSAACPANGVQLCLPSGELGPCRCATALPVDSGVPDAGSTPDAGPPGICVGDGSDGSVTLTDASMFAAARVTAIIGNELAIEGPIGTFSAGDEVLVLQVVDSRSTEVGKYELGRITAATLDAITLRDPIAHAFATASPARVTVQRVPNFTDVMVTETVSPPAWDYNAGRGGLLFFRASGTVTLEASLDASSRGHNHPDPSNDQHGGTPGTADVRRTGGGGGHASAGEQGQGGGAPGGQERGNESIGQLTFGGGGGNAAMGHPDNWCLGGGRGGGAIVVVADRVVGAGALRANGENAPGGGGCAGDGGEATGGGSGAGGSIAIAAREELSGVAIEADPGSVSALGSPSLAGGAGSVGRVALRCEDCTPAPAAGSTPAAELTGTSGSLVYCPR